MSARQAYPGARVVGQTNSEASHERLRAAGVEPRTKAAAAGGGRFSNVIFCAPPSGSTDYAAEARAADTVLCSTRATLIVSTCLPAGGKRPRCAQVAAAGALWDGTGAFVFTSSSAVYADSDGAACDESTPALPLGASPRADALLRAEGAAHAARGTVLRLAGLYTARRGAHTYFMRMPEVPSRGDGYLNLLHYADAASAAVAALRAGAAAHGATFVACDGVPTTREAMMRAALATGLFPDGAMPRWTGASDAPRGRRMDCPATRAALNWAPRYKSFEAFCADGCKE